MFFEMNKRVGKTLSRRLAGGFIALLCAFTTLAPSTTSAATKVYTDNGNGAGLGWTDLHGNGFLLHAKHRDCSERYSEFRRTK
jgi:hypothetical protein